MKQSIIQKIKSLPAGRQARPGIYIFYAKQKPLYVGKAADLRNRLKSYLKITDIKTQSLHEEATKLEWIILRSEIEALIEESRLIKELRPKYNVLWRDDKSYHYVAFTREKFPKIFITHKNLKIKNLKLKIELVGPFTDSLALRLTLKIIRRYFPYCSCLRLHLRDCLNAQIGRCLGYCCKKTIDNKQATFDQYGKNIQKIKMILRGQSKSLLKILKNENEKKALGNILEHRDHIQRINYSAPDVPHPTSNSMRVECYDVSNLAGKEAVGAMTVLKKAENGQRSGGEKIEFVPDKNSYRKFKIKFVSRRDDPRMIAEILERRLNHHEWPYPDLIIIDGGITQYRAAKRTLLKAKSYLALPAGRQVKAIQLISFSKPQKLVYGIKENSQPVPLFSLSAEMQELIEKAIYQTHKFVISFHRNLRSREFILSAD